MVDTYTIMAIGTALGLGAIPLIKQIIKPDPDFLIGHSINKSLMSQAEKEECEKLGKKAFLEKVDREIKEKKEKAKWRQKRRR
jgi:hypothetical protein